MSGLPGFDGSEPDLAIGSVTGVRWWNLQMPAGPDGRPELSLAGVHAADPWTPGENTARCGCWDWPPDDPGKHAVPDEECACGFWAYWAVPDAPNPHNFGIPVLGVIEGYGRTLIGDRGFRCARARIAALHFASDAAATWTMGDDTPPNAYFRTEAALDTWRALTGRRKNYRRASPDEILARLATLELLLQDRYGVPVYPARSLMLINHPPTRDYLPPEKRAALPGRPVLTAAEALARLEASQDAGLAAGGST